MAVLGRGVRQSETVLWEEVLLGIDTIDYSLGLE